MNLHKKRIKAQILPKVLSEDEMIPLNLSETNDPVITVDLSGMIVRVNPAAEILFNTRASSLTGRMLDTFLEKDPDTGDSKPDFSPGHHPFVIWPNQVSCRTADGPIPVTVSLGVIMDSRYHVKEFLLILSVKMN